jgi:hypothetical protein
MRHDNSETDAAVAAVPVSFGTDEPFSRTGRVPDRSPTRTPVTPLGTLDRRYRET